MRKLVLENFGRFRDTLGEALGCEDYEEEGLLELSQLQEAISTVNEELESGVLDYMLYYVLVRSESSEKMQYKVLVDLLDVLINSKARVASAQRKNRPESSSPEKLKMRNPQKVTGSSSKNAKEKATAEALEKEQSNDDELNDTEDDQYTDEEIANDPDEGDDGTKGLMQVKQADKKSSSSDTELKQYSHKLEDEDEDDD